jgi:hypothetical protein
MTQLKRWFYLEYCNTRTLTEEEHLREKEGGLSFL